MEDVIERPVTIAQVARDAGVSIPTVSRVMNGSAPVADATRRSVLRSIEDLGYHPNPMARGLSRGQSDTVLVVVPHITEPSVALRLGGLIAVLRESPYELHLVDLERPASKRLHPLGEIVQRNRPAGVIIFSLPPDEADHRGFRDAGVPVVLVDAPSDELLSDTIDDVAGGVLATQHLISLGHTRIAFVGDQEETAIGVPASADRRRGFQRAMKDARLEVSPQYVRTVPHGTETARTVAEDLLRLEQPPTAVVAASDVQAFGVLAAARDCGIRVPKDLSVVGFDDIYAACLTGLTTVRQPLEISGRRAGLRLLDMLGHRPTQEMPDLPPLKLVVRDTTGPCPSSTAQEPMLAVSIGAAHTDTKVSNRLESASRQAQPIPRRRQ